jgi:hypothetical protein
MYFLLKESKKNMVIFFIYRTVAVSLNVLNVYRTLVLASLAKTRPVSTAIIVIVRGLCIAYLYKSSCY